MIYQYHALDKSGKSVTDYIEASSDIAARDKLRSSGLYVVKITKKDITNLDHSDKTTIRSLFDRLFNFISISMAAKEVGIFSRQLSTLLKAGLPLMTSLTDIIEQIDNKHFQTIMIDVKTRVQEGSSLSNAMSRHKNIFSEMYISMVRVGENLGSLDQVVERLADLEEKRNIIKSKIQSALWYPAFMMLFSFAVVIFLMISVIPSIAEMFREQNRALPLPTEIIITLSNFLSNFWFLIPVFIFFLIYLFRRAAKTPGGRRRIDDFKLKMPVVKNIYKKLITYRFTLNLGILLSNRVDIIKSLEIVQKIVNNVHIEEKVITVTKKIKEGASLSGALAKSDFLPKLVLGMISAGESTDSLDKMLLNIGNVYETEIDMTVTGLTSLIEPIIIIFMGIMIGVIVMSVMLPILDMNSLIQ